MRLIISAPTEHPLVWSITKIENTKPVGIQKLTIYQDFWDEHRDYIERDENGKMTLRRGFVIEKGQRVLVVEDVVTTGGSVREVINLVKEAGGVVVGVGSIVDRTDGKIDFGVPYKAVYSADVVSWEADNCPLCRESGLPLVKPGSRKIK